MPSRKLALFIGSEQELIAFLQQNPDHLWLGDKPLALQIYIKKHIPFTQARNLLGQEFDCIIYDARQGINLEALAIASGTLKQSGLILVLLQTWTKLTQQPDQDSLRWSGANSPISTPYFYQHFQQLCEKFNIPLYSQLQNIEINKPIVLPQSAKTPTAGQQDLFNKITQSQAELIILTAKRGRGKSTLLGFLTRYLQQQQKPFYLTAPNKNAIIQLQDIAASDLPFIAPDELAIRLNQTPEDLKQHTLMIDESAMLPLSQLKLFSQHFKQVIFSTTVQSYEGTGRGFILKFVANLSRPFQHFTLAQPLRWKENDPLEQFIDELLLLDTENSLFPPIAQLASEKIEYNSYSQKVLQQQKKLKDFYSLLSLAHYRTSPVDLRRLFDAPQQQFYLAEQRGNLIGGVWLIEEGTILDAALIEQIALGLRRPQGNLAVQSLCFHQNLQLACQLRSLRISRIAVHPTKQKQGVGQKLVAHICKQAETENRDFISVSFGYNPELFCFWQRCGFSLLYLGEHLEASSGCYSLIMAKAISPAGEQLISQGKKQLERNLSLLPHPLAPIFTKVKEIDWNLTPQDFAMLHKFARYQGNLYSCTPALHRLLRHYPPQNLSISEYLSSSNTININQRQLGKKMWLKIYRAEINNLLQKIHEIL